MGKILTVCAVAVAVFAAGAIASPRAEAVTISSPAGLSVALHKTTSFQYVGGNKHRRPDGHYRQCGYYRYVCRAWWAGCGWEGPYYSPLYRYWGWRYFCR